MLPVHIPLSVRSVYSAVSDKLFFSFFREGQAYIIPRYCGVPCAEFQAEAH